VLLTQYEQEGETFSKHIITEDESYVHIFILEGKHTSSEWRHQNSPRPKKVHLLASAGKVLLTVFWDHKGMILEHDLEQRQTINIERYSDMLLNHLKPAV
jgi:hypothetical protein